MSENSQCALCGFGSPVTELKTLRDVGMVCRNCERAYRLGWKRSRRFLWRRCAG